MRVHKIMQQHNFFPNILTLQLVETPEADPVDMKGQLYMQLTIQCYTIIINQKNEKVLNVLIRIDLQVVLLNAKHQVWGRVYV